MSIVRLRRMTIMYSESTDIIPKDDFRIHAYDLIKLKLYLTFEDIIINFYILLTKQSQKF